MTQIRSVFHVAAESIAERFGSASIGAFVVSSLIKAQKFYVPDCGEMLNGRKFDDFKNECRLPFEYTALLRELPRAYNAAGRRQICIATSEPIVGDGCPADFWVCDALEVVRGGLWVPSRPIGIQMNHPGGSGVQPFEIEGLIEEEQKLTGYAAHSDGATFGALNALSELMVMLSLRNVSTKKIDGPKGLNKKRMSKGKLPIYDYHILTIDGQDTCDVRGDDTSDRAIRSHFRRGHIRRLPDRMTWVRQTMVHGRAPGFVDKDYEVRV